MRTILIETRREMKLKPLDVALQVGITERMYRFYETGDRNPSLKVANKLEDLFKVPQRKLFEGSTK